MSKPKNIKEKIVELREQGLSYYEICQKLNCSKGSVSYHLGEGQKNKSSNRQKLRRKTVHPYQIKLETFRYYKPKSTRIIQNNKYKNKLQRKLTEFRQGDKMAQYNYDINDVINKFGENPKCYLTGDSIDVNKTREYSFDHIIPKSKGGDNSLENLGICTKRANQAKTDMTPDELFFFCKKVLEHQGYQVTKN